MADPSPPPLGIAVKKNPGQTGAVNVRSRGGPGGTNTRGAVFHERHSYWSSFGANVALGDMGSTWVLGYFVSNPSTLSEAPRSILWSVAADDIFSATLVRHPDVTNVFDVGQDITTRSGYENTVKIVGMSKEENLSQPGTGSLWSVDSSGNVSGTILVNPDWDSYSDMRIAWNTVDDVWISSARTTSADRATVLRVVGSTGEVSSTHLDATGSDYFNEIGFGGPTLNPSGTPYFPGRFIPGDHGPDYASTGSLWRVDYMSFEVSSSILPAVTSSQLNSQAFIADTLGYNVVAVGTYDVPGVYTQCALWYLDVVTGDINAVSMSIPEADPGNDFYPHTLDVDGVHSLARSVGSFNTSGEPRTAVMTVGGSPFVSGTILSAGDQTYPQAAAMDSSDGTLWVLGSVEGAFAASPVNFLWRMDGTTSEVTRTELSYPAGIDVPVGTDLVVRDDSTVVVVGYAKDTTARKYGRTANNRIMAAGPEAGHVMIMWRVDATGTETSALVLPPVLAGTGT